MGCRCAERRAALSDAARAMSRGEVATAARQAQAVGRSLAADARRLAAAMARRPKGRS